MQNTKRPPSADTNPAQNAGETPFFSVIIPTRNRPELFHRALQSVLAQSLQDLEVLVVNDGSSDSCMPQYQDLEAKADPRTRWHHLSQRANGHGPSYAINTGANMARGQYLCILDDDDTWEATEHLQQARAAILAAEDIVDAYYSNQIAYTPDGLPVKASLWLNSLAEKLPIPGVIQPAKTHFLLESGGFPHLNCSIIRREFYQDIGGMDEGIRYECEVDLYLRTLDKAQGILYNPQVVARHNVPDAARKSNVSTNVSNVTKRLSQLTVYEKNLANVSREAIRARCRTKLAIVYRNLAAEFAGKADFSRATIYAKMALAVRYTLRWQVYCLLLQMRAAIRG